MEGETMHKGAGAAAFLLLTGLSACGGGSGSTSTPTAPSATPTPQATTDLSGAWSESTGDLTWVLTQQGVTVTGTSNFSQSSGQYLGAVSGNGVIAGTVAGASFNGTDTYATLSKPNCSMRVTLEMSINGNVMTGRYTEVDSCDGAVLGTLSGSLVMRKR
jgi:hypothetical protein